MSGRASPSFVDTEPCCTPLVSVAELNLESSMSVLPGCVRFANQDRGLATIAAIVIAVIIAIAIIVIVL